MTAVAPASIATKKPIREWKERIGRDDRAFRQRGRELQLFRGIFSLARGNACRIDAAHLAGANADSGTISSIHDGVRFHVFGDPECKSQIRKFVLVWRAFGHGLELHFFHDGIVTRLNQQSAGD